MSVLCRFKVGLIGQVGLMSMLDGGATGFGFDCDASSAGIVCQVCLFKYMKNIYVFIIAIAYCFAVRANQFTKKFVRRSACSLGESRELRMLYVLSVILSTISFWRFVFLFALQSCSVTFSQRILYFVTSSDDVFL